MSWRTLLVDYLPWLLSVVTVGQSILTGKKDLRGWLLALIGQALWSVYVISAGAWGLIPLNISLWFVYYRNYQRWRTEMGTKAKPGKFDCYANALPDEPMFILLGRDPTAPERVEDWADLRELDIEDGIRPESDRAMVKEARQCAQQMKEWRKANDGKWRKA